MRMPLLGFFDVLAVAGDEVGQGSQFDRVADGANRSVGKRKVGRAWMETVETVAPFVGVVDRDGAGNRRFIVGFELADLVCVVGGCPSAASGADAGSVID